MIIIAVCSHKNLQFKGKHASGQCARTVPNSWPAHTSANLKIITIKFWKRSANICNSYDATTRGF